MQKKDIKDVTPEDIARVNHSVKVLNEILGDDDGEYLDDEKIIRKPAFPPPYQKPPFRERLLEKLGDVARWAGKTLLDTTVWVLCLLWSCFGVLALNILFVIFTLFLVAIWCFVAYQIAWWLLEDNLSRFFLLVFLVFGPILAYARHNPWTWLSARDEAQAEYQADQIADRLREKD